MPASSFRCDSCACSSASSSSTPLRIAASSASTALLRDSSSCSSSAAAMLSPFSSMSRSVCSAASRWVSRCAVAICLALSSNASIVFCVRTKAIGLASESMCGVRVRVGTATAAASATREHVPRSKSGRKKLLPHDPVGVQRTAAHPQTAPGLLSYSKRGRAHT